ncbi:Sapep family Mn(2+)-dependent dipeptidase [uncultured Faecalibaculum sp.]|uniref:Sapep family Mn(2+)-dependent dipeptidase n=1 Tax=uncultured Faecalibaculum sp. TaxID=1729681 RepID=UPI002622BF4D|nr:Sapep family Mn(2+)-dependent dipeptidase [uncultured Faecalibaculum sp.]
MLEKTCADQLLQLADNGKTEMLEGLFGILSINSERGEPVKGAPYGPGPKKALDKTLKLAESLGFATETVLDQAGIAKYEPEGTAGEPYIGVVGHLDVVPAEGNWTTPPYEPQIRNNRIHARGALDNKGPVISCLYALKAIKDSGIRLKRPVWIIFGTNEETGMEDIPAYLSVKEPPVAGFTPDCKYPVVYAERGRSLYELQFAGEEQAAAWHEAHPDEASLKLDIRDPEFGILQLRNWKQDGNTLTFAASYPPATNAQKILDILRESLPEDTQAKLVSDWKPVFFKKEGPLCASLQWAYETVTGFDGTPVTTTGGTYAKRLPNIVPFGPSFPGQKGIAHLPDEWMDVDDLVANMKIYALAMADLATREL